MKSINQSINKTPVQQMLSNLDSPEKRDTFIRFVEYIDNQNWTKSKKNSHIKLFNHIVNNKDIESAWFDKYKTYISSKSQYEKLEIKYGSERPKQTKSKYNKRINPMAGHSEKSYFSWEYWMAKGLTESEARLKSSYIQSKNGKKAHSKIRLPEDHNPYCIEYWTKKGYSISESESLICELKSRTNGGLSADIKKYGPEIGLEKHLKRQEKRKKTLLKKYGTTVVTGYTSKESLRFFEPLFSTLIQCGIDKNDIYWGVEGSREYANHDNGVNYFYDFTIHSIKVIVEYNNLMWHPRDRDEWFGFIGDYDTLKSKDERKIRLMESKGYKVFVVWCDDDHDLKRKEIVDYVTIQLR